MYYCNFAKLFMHLLKTNDELINKSGNYLQLPVVCLSQNFCWIIKKLHQNFTAAHLKLANIQLKILVELQRMFPDNFHGISAMVETVINLKGFEEEFAEQLSTLIGKFKELLWTQRHSPVFYSDFFKTTIHPSEKQMTVMYELSIEVIDDISGNGLLMSTALSVNEDLNFCLLLIKSLSENPQLIHINPKLYDQITMKLAKLLVARNLGSKNFQFIEKVLIKQILSSHFWISFASFNVFLSFLEKLQAKSLWSEYFQFFQKLLLRMWNPSTEPITMSQLYIISMLKVILVLHPELIRMNIINPGYNFVFNKASASKDSEGRFLKALQLTHEKRSASTYYETVKSLKTLSVYGINDSSSESASKFAELIITAVDSNWNLHSGLILSIMDVMIATSDSQNKILFMLKLNPALNNGEIKSTDVKLKLLDLIFSYIPLAKLRIGLPKILIRELNKLLSDDDLFVQRAVIRKFKLHLSNPDVMELTTLINFDGKVEMTENETKNLILTSRGLKFVHECPKIQHASPSIEPSTNVQPLQQILKYSKTIQPQDLNENDRKVLQQIITNFQKIAQGQNSRNGFS